MNFKHSRLLSIVTSVTAAAIAVSSLASMITAGAETIDSDVFNSQQTYVDTLELYADDASEDPGYEKYYEAVNTPQVQFNSYSVPSKYSKYSTSKGIDVSKYQGSINWKKVKASGVDFAIVRVGFRGYGGGKISIDPTFDTNMKNAIAAGVEIGVYFFSQAINEKEAKEEAEACVKVCQPYKLTYPIYIDMEKDDTGRFANANLNTSQRTAIAESFCKTAISYGYTGGIYANKYWLNTKLDSAELQNSYAIWLAHYTNCTDYKGEYDLWQYSDQGSVNGITGAVDENVFFNKPNSKTRNAAVSAGETNAETETESETVMTKNMFLLNEKIGDVIADGKINAKDATAVLKYSASKLANIKTELKPEQEKNADVNLDGKIDSVDAVLILRYAAYSIIHSDKTFGQFLVTDIFKDLPEKTTETTEPTESTNVSETTGASDVSETGETGETVEETGVSESTEVTEQTESTEPTEDGVKSDASINNK